MAVGCSSKGDGSYGTDGTRMPGRHTHDQSGVPGATAGSSEYGSAGQSGSLGGQY